MKMYNIKTYTKQLFMEKYVHCFALFVDDKNVINNFKKKVHEQIGDYIVFQSYKFESFYAPKNQYLCVYTNDYNIIKNLMILYQSFNFNNHYNFIECMSPYNESHKNILNVEPDKFHIVKEDLWYRKYKFKVTFKKPKNKISSKEMPAKCRIVNVKNKMTMYTESYDELVSNRLCIEETLSDIYKCYTFDELDKMENEL